MKVSPSAELASALLDASLDGVAAFDRQARFTYWNAAMERIYGFRQHEALGRVAFELLPFLRRSGEDKSFYQVLEGKEVELKEDQFHVPETSRSGIAQTTYKPLCDTRGDLIGGIVIVRDVTERKRAEEHLKEMESRFIRMADSSPVLLWMSGTDSLCNFFNQTWLNFTGRTLEQELGVGWAEGVHPFDFQLCVDTYIEAFNARRAFEMEYRLRRADGEYRWILDRGTPRYNPDGSFAGFIGSCIDITERKTMIAALHEALTKAESANQLKSEFLANISHELRTPLNALINVPLSTLKDFPIYAVWECPKCNNTFKRTEEDGPQSSGTSNTCPDCDVEMKLTRRAFYVGDSDKTVHFLERMVQSGQHLLKVVNDILDFSKIDAGRVRLFVSEVSVEDLIKEVDQTLGPVAEEKKISVKLPSLVAPVMIMVDRVKVMQILINLLTNAIKFTPENGTVALEVAEGQYNKEPCVEFAIKDTGIGIPADKLKAIFDSFRQADGGHTRAHQGTGLGLAISKQLVELHGGRIWVESRVGEGSTFRFVLPNGASPTQDSKQLTQQTAQKGRVFIMGDDPAGLAKPVLENAGFGVTVVERSERVLEAVQRGEPDCILLDMGVNDLDGLTLLRQLKEGDKTSATPVLVTTSQVHNREMVQRLGGVWFPKPWSDEDLVERVGDLIGHARKRGEAS